MNATAHPTPLAAALAALAALPSPEPVAAVEMAVGTRLAIIGPLAAALGWAERLAGQREVTVFALDEAGEIPVDAAFAVIFTGPLQLGGHLGAFTLRWQGAAGEQTATADSVLDLSPQALFKRVELPPGYAAPGRDPLDQALAIIDLLAYAGDYEKPRYAALNERLCAHGRAQQAGCRNCLEVCASEAITTHGNSVALDPYLCQGCGSCTTVCPSGALSYQYPRVADLGLAIKAQLQAYRAAGGESPALLFHAAEAGKKLLAGLARSGRALSPAFIPVETWSVDAVGLDLLLGAVALGAGRVAVLGAGSHDLAPLRQQAALGETILEALGYGGEHLRIVDSESADWLAELAAWTPPTTVAPAEFRLLADKRTSLEFIVDHLARYAPTPVDSIALAAGAPFGTLAVADACTLCMACVGACPAGALKAAADAPRLSFLERNCLQCGLCANTCPERAITLTPRLLVKDRRQERLLKEAEIFCCTGCGKAMGAAPTVLGMIERLAGHSMFATPAARARLSMCADCRVVDLINHEESLQAWEINE